MELQDPSLAALVPVLLDRMPAILDEVAAELGRSWPDYAAFLTANSAQVGSAAEAAVERLVTLAEATDADAGTEAALFEQIGRAQWRMGKDLSELMAAFQAGARVFWHAVSAIAVDTDVPPRVLAALAEAVFVFVDRLTSSTARGYVMAQSEAAATRERMREELVDLLLSGRADHGDIANAAANAGWLLPDTATVVLVQPDGAAAHRALARMAPSDLVFHRKGLWGVIVPSPSIPELRQRLPRIGRDVTFVVGVRTALDRLPVNLHIVEIAARLQHDGVLTDPRVFIEDHLDAIIVHRDARLLDALRHQVLAPLDQATPGSRERLLETLVAWLRHMGDRQAIAADLHVHPQTVRYRLARLHELFGPSLDDPDVRARLLLALHWHGCGGVAWRDDPARRDEAGRRTAG